MLRTVAVAQTLERKCAVAADLLHSWGDALIVERGIVAVGVELCLAARARPAERSRGVHTRRRRVAVLLPSEVMRPQV